MGACVSVPVRRFCKVGARAHSAGYAAVIIDGFNFSLEFFRCNVRDVLKP